MICPNCGAEIDAYDGLCSSCGAGVAGPSASASSPSPTANGKGEKNSANTIFACQGSYISLGSFIDTYPKAQQLLI